MAKWSTFERFRDGEHDGGLADPTDLAFEYAAAAAMEAAVGKLLSLYFGLPW